MSINDTSLNNLYQYKDYIINVNIQLTDENKKLIIKNKELEQEILQQENEEEKYDNRMRYIKGLLNNLYELKNMYYKLSENSNNITNNYIDYEKNINNFFFNFYIKNIILYALLILLNIFIHFIDMYNLLIYLIDLHNIKYYILILYSVNIIIIYNLINLHYKFYNYYNKSSKKLTINNDNIQNINNSLKYDIKKIEESTLSLDNWINEI